MEEFNVMQHAPAKQDRGALRMMVLGQPPPLLGGDPRRMAPPKPLEKFSMKLLCISCVGRPCVRGS